MHLTINLDGTEKPDTLQRVSAAILALGGLTPASTSSIELRMNAGPIRDALADPLAEIQALEQGHRVAAGDVGSKMDEVTVPAPLPPPPPPPPVDVPAAAVAAPSTTAPAAAPATSQPAVDKDGLPWDERIHSGARSFNKNGTWRLRKGVAAHLVASVEAELRGGTPPPPAAAPPPPTVTGLTFGAVVARVQEASSTGTVTPDQTAAALAQIGVASLMDLNKRPDLFETFLATLGV